MDHHDYSNPYTEDSTGRKSWEFDMNAPHFQYDDVHKRIKIRETELEKLVDEITLPNFL
jgi:hypothetical protein